MDMRLNEIENNVVADFRQNPEVLINYSKSDSLDEWLRFGLSILLRVGKIIRQKRLSPLSDQVSFKADGSPVSKTDCSVEEYVRHQLTLFRKDASIIGEEGGGLITRQGYAVAVDPIDGTWSYLNRLETIATSLLFTYDNKPFLGMVFNPVSGELGYGGEKIPPRILQFSMFGEGDRGFDLPLEVVTPNSILVNIHPQRTNPQILTSFYSLWGNNEIKMVKSAGGSPAKALLDVAKGSSNYINFWGNKQAAPYDLASGVAIIRSSGGEVVDINGTPIRWFNHTGPFLAVTKPEVANVLLPHLQAVVVKEQNNNVASR